MYKIVVIKKDGTDGSSYPITPGVQPVLGSEKEKADIRIDLEGVAPEHCKLTSDSDGNLSVEPLSMDSMLEWSTELNGVEVLVKSQLKTGDLLTVGGRKFRIDPLDSGPRPRSPIRAPTIDSGDKTLPNPNNWPKRSAIPRPKSAKTVRLQSRLPVLANARKSTGHALKRHDSGPGAGRSQSQDKPGSQVSKIPAFGVKGSARKRSASHETTKRNVEEAEGSERMSRSSFKKLNTPKSLKAAVQPIDSSELSTHPSSVSQQIDSSGALVDFSPFPAVPIPRVAGQSTGTKNSSKRNSSGRKSGSKIVDESINLIDFSTTMPLPEDSMERETVEASQPPTSLVEKSLGESTLEMEEMEMDLSLGNKSSLMLMDSGQKSERGRISSRKVRKRNSDLEQESMEFELELSKSPQRNLSFEEPRSFTGSKTRGSSQKNADKSAESLFEHTGTEESLESMETGTEGIIVRNLLPDLSVDSPNDTTAGSFLFAKNNTSTPGHSESARKSRSSFVSGRNSRSQSEIKTPKSPKEQKSPEKRRSVSASSSKKATPRQVSTKKRSIGAKSATQGQVLESFSDDTVMAVERILNGIVSGISSPSKRSLSPRTSGKVRKLGSPPRDEEGNEIPVEFAPSPTREEQISASRLFSPNVTKSKEESMEVEEQEKEVPVRRSSRKVTPKSENQSRKSLPTTPDVAVSANNTPKKMSAKKRSSEESPGVAQSPMRRRSRATPLVANVQNSGRKSAAKNTPKSESRRKLAPVDPVSEESLEREEMKSGQRRKSGGRLSRSASKGAASEPRRVSMRSEESFETPKETAAEMKKSPKRSLKTPKSLLKKRLTRSAEKPKAATSIKKGRVTKVKIVDSAAKRIVSFSPSVLVTPIPKIGRMSIRSMQGLTPNFSVDDSSSGSSEGSSAFGSPPELSVYEESRLRLTGVRQMAATPREPKERIRTPLTGVKNLVRTPKNKKSQGPISTPLTGVKQLMELSGSEGRRGSVEESLESIVQEVEQVISQEKTPQRASKAGISTPPVSTRSSAKRNPVSPSSFLAEVKAALKIASPNEESGGRRKSSRNSVADYLENIVKRVEQIMESDKADDKEPEQPVSARTSSTPARKSVISASIPSSDRKKAVATRRSVSSTWTSGSANRRQSSSTRRSSSRNATAEFTSPEPMDWSDLTENKTIDSTTRRSSGRKSLGLSGVSFDQNEARETVGSRQSENKSRRSKMSTGSDNTTVAEESLEMPQSPEDVAELMDEIFEESIRFSGRKKGKPKTPATARLSGVKRLLGAKGVVQGISPRNLAGVKNMLGSKKEAPKTPSLVGVKEIVRSPKRALKTPVYVGVKELMNEKKSAEEVSLVGVRETLRSPKQGTSPSYAGVKKMIKTPKQRRSASLEGIENLIETPEETAAVTAKSKATGVTRGRENLGKPVVEEIESVIGQSPPKRGRTRVNSNASPPKKESPKKKTTGVKIGGNVAKPVVEETESVIPQSPPKRGRTRVNRNASPPKKESPKEKTTRVKIAAVPTPKSVQPETSGRTRGKARAPSKSPQKADKEVKANGRKTRGMASENSIAKTETTASNTGELELEVEPLAERTRRKQPAASTKRTTAKAKKVAKANAKEESPSKNTDKEVKTKGRSTRGKASENAIAKSQTPAGEEELEVDSLVEKSKRKQPAATTKRAAAKAKKVAEADAKESPSENTGEEELEAEPLVEKARRKQPATTKKRAAAKKVAEANAKESPYKNTGRSTRKRLVQFEDGKNGDSSEETVASPPKRGRVAKQNARKTTTSEAKSAAKSVSRSSRSDGKSKATNAKTEEVKQKSAASPPKRGRVTKQNASKTTTSKAKSATESSSTAKSAAAAKPKAERKKGGKSAETTKKSPQPRKRQLRARK